MPKKKQYLAIFDTRGMQNFTRKVIDFDTNGNRIELYPKLFSLVWNFREWKEHWEDIITYDPDEIPVRFKDFIHLNKPEDIHPSFMQEITKQLTPIINEKVGEELQNKDYMLKIVSSIPYNENGFSYMSLDFHCPGECSSLYIKWKALRENRYISMSEPVSSEDIQFEILTSREVDIISPKYNLNHWIETAKKYLKPIHTLHGKTGDNEFTVELLGHNWPDTITDIQLRKNITPEMITEFDNKILEFMSQWNEKDDKGQIHDIGKAEKLSDIELEIVSDFGSGNPEVLMAWVNLIDSICGKYLKYMIIK